MPSAVAEMISADVSVVWSMDAGRFVLTGKDAMRLKTCSA